MALTIHTSQMGTSIVNEAKKYYSLWNLIFSQNNDTPWISLKPRLGIQVYPCYACRDMMSSKTTFQDHINRRVIMLKYKCGECKETLIFYNRCAFLLHARTHYTLVEGKIDLNNVEIFSLPFGMMGFLPYPGVCTLYDHDEDLVSENCYINTQFYSPDQSERGKQVVTLKPNDLLFCSNEDDPNGVIQMTLKQISRNIPLCEFVSLDYQKKLRQTCRFTDSVKEEPVDSNEHSEGSSSPVSNENVQLPVISRIESMKPQDNTSLKCPECKLPLKYRLKVHFTDNNIPLDENLMCPVCKYVAATKCSFSAHQRIHANVAPFVCPECGLKYESMKHLKEHMDEVCYHLSKQIRIRCPGKRCGKLLASVATFTAHFVQHVNPWLQCNVCKSCFGSFIEFSEHSKVHSMACTPERVIKCSGCKIEDSIIRQEHVNQHIEFHSKDRMRYMYVYICKYCKNFFRSNGSFATHLTKCQRMMEIKRQEFAYTVDTCRKCQNRIIFYENDKSAACSKCYCITLSPLEREKRREKNENGGACVLCHKDVPNNDYKSHESECAYRNPVIVLDRLGHENKSNNDNSSQKSPDSKLKLSTSPRSGDNSKRKRKKAPLVLRGKKPMILNSPSEEVIDLQADQPMAFNGTYFCKLCKFQQDDRDLFHQHVITHRHISTAYQCMECGECFVVKPSLVKHLMHYHKIQDTNAYFDANDCYDKGAVQELKEIMKLVPGETREAVGENQCRVCRQQFSDGQELSKHFRIHGMAFLMKNTRE